jgi:hypothetical protein
MLPMKSDDQKHYIFYVQYTKKLPQTFFALGQVLQKFNLTLVPVSPRELINVAKAQKQFIISITADLTSLKGLESTRRSFLDFALVNQKFCLFDVTSFGKISISYKLEKNRSYLHYALPMSFNNIASNIASHYFSELGTVKRWPGGSRAKLPAMA